jgi:MFS family permease
LSDGIKNAFTIQVMNAFIIGAMTIVVPLLMVERGIDVESMGLIFAILPVVSQTARITFGVVSDFVGRKIFYKLNSVLNVVFMMAYYFANQPLDFLLGKIAEGLRDASLWSVNRAYITDNSYEKKDLLIKMSGLGSVFSSFGTIFAGLMISLLFYGNTILACVLVALFIIPQTFKLRDGMKKEASILSILRAFDIRKRNDTFKNFIIIFFISGLGWGLISGYIMPLFLSIMGHNSQQIGLVLGVRGLVLGMITYFIAARFPDKKLILFGGLAFAFFTALL